MKKWIILLMFFTFQATAQDEFFVLSGQSSSTLREGLISYWEFDEVSGTTAFDSNGSNAMTIATGVTVNQPGSTSLSYDKSYSYNGTSGQLNLTNATPFSGLSAITISAWVYSTYTTTTDEYRIITSKLHSSWVSPYYQFQLRVRFGSQKVFEFIVGTSTAFSGATSSTNSYFTGFWRHVVGMYDSTTGNIRLYVDGEYNVANIPVPLYEPIGTANTPFHIGDDSDLFSNFKNWNGKIDKVMIYNRELTLPEIEFLYNGGVGRHFNEL